MGREDDPEDDHLDLAMCKGDDPLESNHFALVVSLGLAKPGYLHEDLAQTDEQINIVRLHLET